MNFMGLLWDLKKTRETIIFVSHVCKPLEAQQGEELAYWFWTLERPSIATAQKCTLTTPTSLCQSLGDWIRTLHCLIHQ